jgi:queuosine precursor transporter
MALFTGCFLVSNIIAGKQLQLPFGITMTGAVIVFPITYILSDLFSEVYGYRWSRITCYVAFTANVLMVLAFAIVINTPAPSYWTNQEAFATVLGNTPRVLVGSLLAFVAGDFVNDRVFRKMKAKYPNSHKGFGVRSILSSVCGAVIDSAIFIPIAFIGTMPGNVLLVMGVTQVCLKLLYEVIVLPVNRLVTIKISAIEQKSAG